MDETDEEIGKWIDFYEQIKTQGPPQEKSPDRRNLGSSSTKVDESDESEQEEPSNIKHVTIQNYYDIMIIDKGFIE